MKRNSAKKKRERKAHRSYLELNLLHDHVFHSRAEVSRFEDDVLFSSHVEKHYYFGLLLLLLLLREEDRLWIAPHQILSLAGVGQRSSSLEHQNALLFVFSSGSPASSSSFDSSSPSSSSRCDALSRGWCSSTREQRGGEVTNISRKRKIRSPFSGFRV